MILFRVVNKAFEHNIVTIFCKFLPLKKSILNTVISTVIINSAIGATCFMEDICANKTRKLTTMSREAIFQIFCGHWFWAVEKKSWMYDQRTICSFHMSKRKWREEWVQV